MTQTATEKAQAGAAKANAQGHAVATDLHAKVITTSLYQQQHQHHDSTSCA
jgi:hypothetical protein